LDFDGLAFSGELASVPLLETALGRNPDLFRYAVRAMEAANPNDRFPNASC